MECSEKIQRLCSITWDFGQDEPWDGDANSQGDKIFEAIDGFNVPQLGRVPVGMALTAYRKRFLNFLVSVPELLNNPHFELFLSLSTEKDWNAHSKVHPVSYILRIFWSSHPYDVSIMSKPSVGKCRFESTKTWTSSSIMRNRWLGHVMCTFGRLANSPNSWS